MNTTYLITASEVRTICYSVNQEIADDIINNAILLIQDTLLKDSLTYDLWVDIFANSGTTANQYLINNFLKNIIAYGVWQFLVVTLSYQLNAAGLRLKTSDHSTLAESNDMAYYRGYIQNFIDNTRRLMEEYIEDHPGDYPLYYVYEHGKKPSINNFSMGRVGGGKSNFSDECQYWKTR